MIAFVPVHGTWGHPPQVGDWWLSNSELMAFLGKHGLEPLRPSDPFLWSGDVNGGIDWPWSSRDHTDWQAGGHALRWYLREGTDYVPINQRRIVSHSHGLQVVLYACAQGLKIDRLLSITGPVRDDMKEIAAMARPNIGRWHHAYSDGDRMQAFGAMLDGAWGIHRKAIYQSRVGLIAADQNIGIKKIGHSGVLRDPQYFEKWTGDGLIDFLRAA